MPNSSEQWLLQTDDELRLYSSVYWVSLAGAAELPNTSSVTVAVPIADVFDRAQLEAMMTRAEAGSPL